MLVDWFTVVAQVINFLILVWLMKRFLYQPVLHAIDAREQRIANELADADARRAEAQRERDDYQNKNEEFDRQRAQRLRQAMDEVDAERRRLLEEARRACEDLRTKRQDALAREHQSLNDEITRATRREVYSIARKTLADLADTTLEARMGDVFVHRLRTMDVQTKDGLDIALETGSAPALVRSAFDLPAAQRASIKNALNEIFLAEIQVRFETVPDLISGVELSAHGQKLAWSIADYLTALERSVDVLLRKPSRTDSEKR